ncbi:nickel-responsive transcriptional regulator NikR [candidate division KSB3 bacterium]|uniref:Putative nickel-responsive regulator n=1 Tax=candidate division KSB3 bacterium TaxID=2044937 RepID=A0A9D5Q5L4_9BACT|nr:nickel-responsive transcriptional regulator NikR [candidate division KSB3 bacterium]MBD3324463.1 nickel-responsive transcriptional regulator NikR [candidate division KSB3 bacterium]
MHDPTDTHHKDAVSHEADAGKLVRFGVSIDGRLLEKFDEMIAEKYYANRSEAIRDVIRDQLVEFAWSKSHEDVVGTLTLVYNHESRELSDKLIRLQHSHHAAIISTLHVHLDEHNCLEVLVMQGQSKEIKSLSEKLIGTKGVKHGKLTMSTTGKELY